MIDKNAKPSPLQIAKEIARKYINNPIQHKFDQVVDEKTGKTIEKVTEVPVTSIYVTIQDHGIYLNADKESVEEYAMRTTKTLVTVMEDGVVTGEQKKEKKTKQ